MTKIARVYAAKMKELCDEAIGSDIDNFLNVNAPDDMLFYGKVGKITRYKTKNRGTYTESLLEILQEPENSGMIDGKKFEHVTWVADDDSDEFSDGQYAIFKWGNHSFKIKAIWGSYDGLGVLTWDWEEVELREVTKIRI